MLNYDSISCILNTSTEIVLGGSSLGSGIVDGAAVAAQVNNADLDNRNPSTESTVLQSQILQTSTPLQKQQQQGDVGTLSEKDYSRSTTPKLKRRSLVVDSDEEESYGRSSSSSSSIYKTNTCDTPSNQQSKKAKVRHSVSSMSNAESKDSSDCFDMSPIHPFESFKTPMGRRCPLTLRDTEPKPNSEADAPRTTHSNSFTLVSEPGQGLSGATHTWSRNALYITKKVLKVYLPVKDTPGVNFPGIK